MNKIEVYIRIIDLFKNWKSFKMLSRGIFKDLHVLTCKFNGK